ncbi:MAG: SoxR reducing system RseC family protein [Clostridia bacterium]|nr:SoxR reducing system RseC family protein [Clostridia bacterium]
MEKFGTVTKIEKDKAVVTVIRDSACGENCAACGICKNSKEMTMIVPGDDFKVGDKVRLVTDDKTFLKSSAIGYLLLTALLIVGGVMGAKLGGDWAAFIGALLGLGTGVVLIRCFFAEKIEIRTEKVER